MQSSAPPSRIAWPARSRRCPPCWRARWTRRPCWCTPASRPGPSHRGPKGSETDQGRGGDNMNNKPSLFVLLTAAWLMPAGAQNIYRCGDSYSQKPCPGGTVVQAEDPRSASQRSQTNLAAERDAKTADAMEKARIKEEAKPAQAYIPPAKQLAVAQKAKEPAPFKAVAPMKPGDAPVKPKKTKPKTKAKSV